MMQTTVGSPVPPVAISHNLDHQPRNRSLESETGRKGSATQPPMGSTQGAHTSRVHPMVLMMYTTSLRLQIHQSPHCQYRGSCIGAHENKDVGFAEACNRGSAALRAVRLSSLVTKRHDLHRDCTVQ